MRPERLDGVLPGAMRQHAPLFLCQNTPVADDRINRFFLVNMRWLQHLEPLSAVLFAALLLGEKMSVIQYVGVVCIIGGAMIGELIRKKTQ